MSDSKHTPGSWRVYEDRGSDAYEVVPDHCDFGDTVAVYGRTQSSNREPRRCSTSTRTEPAGWGMRARVLLSGGMDSAACLAWARLEYEQIDAVFFSYGQLHRDQEYRSAVRLARHFGVNHWSVPLEITAPSSLTGDGGKLHGPDVVVPDRNCTMLRQAASIFSAPDVLVMGCCRDDWEVFADCRPEFFDRMRQELHPVSIETPLIELDKRGVFDFAQTYGGTALLDLSWSCYAGGEDPCGSCGACAARAGGMP